MEIPTVRCEECETTISVESACECYQCHRVLCREHCEPTADAMEHGHDEARCIACASAEAAEAVEGWVED